MSSTVLHWVPKSERRDSFEGIFKCLKPNSWFVFDAARSKKYNFKSITRKLSNQQQFLQHFFPITKEDAWKCLSDAGFHDIEVKEVETRHNFPDLDSFLRWMVASLHTEKYEQVLMELRQLCVDADLSELIDGGTNLPVFKLEYIYVKCRKPWMLSFLHFINYFKYLYAIWIVLFNI